MTIPTIGNELDERAETDSVSDAEAAAENFRHIVCHLCFPAFARALVAPHDATCVCGKPLKQGDTPGPRAAPECVLCREMAEPHVRTVHGGGR